MGLLVLVVCGKGEGWEASLAIFRGHPALAPARTHDSPLTRTTSKLAHQHHQANAHSPILHTRFRFQPHVERFMHVRHLCATTPPLNNQVPDFLSPDERLPLSKGLPKHTSTYLRFDSALRHVIGKAGTEGHQDQRPIF
jgi:hypothetical protein